MGSAPQFIFPGAIMGSVILAILASLVTAGLSLPVAMASPPEVMGSHSLNLKNDQPEINNQEEEEKEGKENCQVSQRFPEMIQQWCGEIAHYARKNGLDPDLMAALIWQESGGNPLAYSRSGAVGLMQVMPRDGIAASFMCKNGPCFTNRPTISELQDPVFNIKFGTEMLAGLLARYGDIREALRYYGPKDVGYYYADKVLGLYEKYKN